MIEPTHNARPSRRELVIGAAAAAVAAGTPAGAAGGVATPVMELRQYKIAHGRRDELIALFEREFVASQDAIGMRVAGTFRDIDDPNRFTWLRAFPSMARRADDLAAFYHGPVWKAHRDAANAMLDDNDNVLLLRPAWAGAELPDTAPPSVAGGIVAASIHYLWRDPSAGFAAFFRDRIAPAAAAAGLPVLGAFTPVAEPNNFPRLPVRTGEKVFVWFTHARSAEAHARARRTLARSLPRPDADALADQEERAPQVLRLSPTPTSALR